MLAEPALCPPRPATLADAGGQGHLAQEQEVPFGAAAGGVRVLPGSRGRGKLLTVYCLCIYFLVDGSSVLYFIVLTSF